MKRTAALGYGTKSDFTKSTVLAPPPDAYNLKSDFDK
jgi:hypothetical protein